MQFLNKAQIKELLHNSSRNPVQGPELSDILKLNMDISSWYHHHGVSCINRTAYKMFLTRKFGHETYTNNGVKRNTNWGFIAANGVKVLVFYSSKGTDYQIGNEATTSEQWHYAVKELRDYLYDKNSFMF